MRLWRRRDTEPPSGPTPRPPDDDVYEPLAATEPELARALASQFAARLEELGGARSLAHGVALAVREDDDWGQTLRLRVPATDATYWRYEWNGTLEDALPYVRTCAELTLERVAATGEPPSR